MNPSRWWPSRARSLASSPSQPDACRAASRATVATVTTLEAGVAVLPEEEPADGDDERPEAESRGHGPLAVDSAGGSGLDGLAGNDVASQWVKTTPATARAPSDLNPKRAAGTTIPARIVYKAVLRYFLGVA